MTGAGKVTMPDHTIKLVIDTGDAYVTIACPHDAADETRPCWPHDESGERMGTDEGKAVGCVFSDWIDNCGLEAIAGRVEMTFVAGPIYGGDFMEFTLNGDPKDVTHA